MVAHNAFGFDALVWEHLGWPDVEWIDTLPLARTAALPAGLDVLAHRLYSIGKDIEGRKLTLALARYDKHGRLPLIDPDTRTRVIRYCRRDVELLAQIWDGELEQVYRHLDGLTGEHDVLELDCRINRRGFLFDRELAFGLVECSEALVAEARRGVPEGRLPLLTSPAKHGKRWRPPRTRRHASRSCLRC